MPSQQGYEDNSKLLLPYDVWSSVLKHVSQTDRLGLRLVCKAFSKCCRDTVIEAVIKSRAGARSLELFLNSHAQPHQATLNITLSSHSGPLALLYSMEWVCPFITMLVSYGHLQSLDISSYPLDIITASSILSAAPRSLTSLALHVPVLLVAAHAWRQLDSLQHLTFRLIPEGAACDPVGVMQLASLTSLSFRGPASYLVKAEGFGLPQLRGLAMNSNAFLGHLDLAKFPQLVEVAVGHDAQHLSWLLHYPIPRLIFAGAWPCWFDDKSKQLYCSQLCIILTHDALDRFDDTWRSVDAQWLLQLPQLRSLRLHGCPCPGNMYRFSIYGSQAEYRKLLQQLQIAASASVKLCLIDDGHNEAD